MHHIEKVCRSNKKNPGTRVHKLLVDESENEVPKSYTLLKKIRNVVTK